MGDSRELALENTKARLEIKCKELQAANLKLVEALKKGVALVSENSPEVSTEQWLDDRADFEAESLKIIGEVEG